MKRTTILALAILGGTTFAGLGVLFTSVFPETFDFGSGAGTLVPLLTVSVAAALFVLGIFLGYLYRDSVSNDKASKAAVERFKDALGFERGERARLGGELYDAKQTVVNLRDRLGQLETERREDDSSEREELVNQIDKLTNKSDRLKRDLSMRKNRIADLMAEVSIAQAEAEQEKVNAAQIRASAKDTPLLTTPDEATVKDILEHIVELEGVKVALVADDYGLVVASVGDALPSETVAAISSLVADFGPKVSDILPMGDLVNISFGDDEGLVLDTRFFELYGARCALAIAHDEDHPHPGIAKQAIEAITAKFQ